MHFHIDLVLPTVVFSDSYDEGRYNKPYGGGDWNEYQRGKNERDWYNRTTQGDTNSANKSSGGTNWGNNSGGGGGGGGCGIVILAAIAFAIAVPSALAALISSMLVILILKRALPSFSSLAFRNTYLAFFWTSFTYLAIATAAAFLLVWLYPTINGWQEYASNLTLLKYFYFPRGTGLVKPFNLLGFHAGCILLSALVLQRKMKQVFSGIKGYGSALGVTGLVVLPSLIVTFYLAIFILKKYGHQNLLF